jgi:prepilin-type N-terminal cleavage/methylation domain-containing protein
MKKGFTLIELLVVIAIIGIISTISITFLSSARLKVKDGRVISNLKQAKTIVELNRGSDGNVPAQNIVSDIPDFSKLSKDVCAQQGVSCVGVTTIPSTSKPAGIIKSPFSSGSGYCLYSWLPSGKSSDWSKAACVDSNGKTNFSYTGDTPCSVSPIGCN